MKLATCEYENRRFLGAVLQSEGVVLDLAELAADAGRASSNVELVMDMAAFLASGGEGITFASELIDSSDSKNSGIPIRSIRFRAPVERPGKLFCLAGNYAEHIEECNEKLDRQDKETPRFFIKPSANTVIGDGDAIVMPSVARSVDWEGELAVVIGSQAKRAKPEDAIKHVAGYTIMNDVSERKLKIWERSTDRPKDEWFDWLNGKWCDTFAPMGPWLVTTDEIPDPHDLTISTRVNGELKQKCSTADMIFKIPELIAYISSIVTLEPGDVISTGTIAGVGMASGVFLKPGDEIEISISSIGLLHSAVRSEIE